MMRNKYIMFEGEWYEIHGFKLMHNFRRFRITTNRFHVLTGENTIINNVPARTDCNYYGFKEFKTILRSLSHPMYSVDLFYISLGRFTFITNIEGCSRIEFEPNIPEIIAFCQL
ncbi:hypothetical protein Bca4012_010288 [Brassica carinata]